MNLIETLTQVLPSEQAMDIVMQAKWFFAGYLAAMPFMVVGLAIRVFRKLGSNSPDL